METFLFFILIFVMLVGAVALGVAFGRGLAGKDATKTEDFFLRRDHYRKREKELKKRLADAEYRAKKQYEDNISLRIVCGELSDELSELRVRLSKAEKAKERRNNE